MLSTKFIENSFWLLEMRPLPHICFHFPFLKERRAELEMDDDEVATRSAIQFKISNLFPQFQQIPMKFWRQLTHFERNVTLATAISTLSRYKWKEWEKLHIVSEWMNLVSDIGDRALVWWNVDGSSACCFVGRWSSFRFSAAHES